MSGALCIYVAIEALDLIISGMYLMAEIDRLYRGIIVEFFNDHRIAHQSHDNEDNSEDNVFDNIIHILASVTPESRQQDPLHSLGQAIIKIRPDLIYKKC